MKTNATTKKLKLVYSFNGKFRRRSPGNKLRYTGGETRIVSVDPTTLTYSELRSLITERVNTNSDEFTLKYRLPGAESVGGGDSPLVLLASDDDVLCMVEEFEAYYGKKNNCINTNSVRIWVYVCTNDDYDYDYDNDDDKISGNDGHVVGFSEKSSDFGCGFRVFGRNIVDSLKGNNLGFKKLPDNNHNHNNHNHNVGGRNYGSKRKGSGNEQDSLRKLVLKQQLMLARQRDQIQGLGRSLGPNYKVPDHDHGDKPLIDLGIDRCGLIPASQMVCDQGSGDRNLCMEKKNRDSVSCAQEIGSKMAVQCLNEEIKNVLPLDSGVFCGDQVVGGGTVVNCVNTGHESHFGMVRLSENPALSSAVKCCTGQEARSSISQQGQAMRLYMEKTISPKLDKGDNVTQGDVIAAQSLQMYNYAAVNLPEPLEEPSLIDFGDELRVVEYEEYCVNGSDTTMNYQPNSHDASISTIYMVPKVVDNAISEVEPEITKQIVMVPTPNCTATSMDLSSYNPASLSSSKMATPKSSYMSPEGLDMFQLRLVDSTVEAKLTDGSNRKAASDSVEATPAKWDQSCTLQQDIQDDSSGSTDVDEKVIIRTSLKYSNMADGVPSDLAAFYTHLATKELQTIRDSDLEYVKELGTGNYGTVYHGKWRGSDVAVKKIKPSCFNGEAKEEDRLVADFWKEAHMLSQLHHPNIVAFYGVVTDGPITNLATVTEYMINGSLKQVLLRKDRTIDRRKRLILAMDAAFGMEYLHEKNIVHFDLKSHNFLVNMRDPHRPVCKIGDLGLSKIKQRTMVSRGVRGTIPWMAPELLNISTKLVSEKVDVYSFGIVMWELLTGEEPYADMRSGEIIAGIIKGTLRPEIPSWCDPAWRSLMESCWSSDPESRPSFSEIAKELRAIATSMNIK